ncbi:TnsA-like heteromeric transposase endonuclease subunit [Streptomyces anulatus]|jgi:hypothetical protein|uniref:TnsA-like heteromeric transposase endonuclease subunit n=1 Tax=Streptomyces anulatus TaxID=1892 RepID=UPI00364937B6|nr:TnsA-like heteromeric transposase endonuclease subunit [Streptomyces anulatus]
MTQELRVLHYDTNGVRRILPVDRLTGVALAERGEVWKPTRHPAQRSIVTWWWAETNRRLVGCRSLDRLSTAMLLDFHPGVVDLGAWSAQLIWRERGRERRLVPDFFVHTASGSTVMVVSRPAKEPGERFERQMSVCREACRQAGWRLATPQLPNRTALANLRWVSRRRHPRFSNGDVESALAVAFAEPQPLVEGVKGCGVPRSLALPRLYHMLWKRRLGVDWAVPLGPGSIVGPMAVGGPQAMGRPFTEEQA